MSKSWDDMAVGWDTNQSVVDYSNRVFQMLRDRIDLKGLRILDFGCGTGLLTAAMAVQASEVVGIDTSSSMITELDKKSIPNVKTLCQELDQGLIGQHSYFIDRFDLITASSVCAFLPNYIETLKLIASVLKVGGLFIQWDWEKQSPDDEFGLTVSQIKSAYFESGLQAEVVEKAFEINGEGGSMNVIMGKAKK